MSSALIAYWAEGPCIAIFDIAPTLARRLTWEYKFPSASHWGLVLIYDLGTSNTLLEAAVNLTGLASSPPSWARAERVAIRKMTVKDIRIERLSFSSSRSWNVALA